MSTNEIVGPLTLNEWKELLVWVGDHFGMNMRTVDEHTVGAWAIRFTELSLAGRDRFYEERGNKMNLNEWLEPDNVNEILTDAAFLSIAEVIPQAITHA